MYYNYLKVALRNLLKNKIYSIINIGGLAIGISVSVLILLIVAHEYSYDRFHQYADQIYLKRTKISLDDREMQLFSPPEFGPDIKKSSPEVLDFCRTIMISGKTVQADQQHRFLEDHFLFADPSFFSIFSFVLVKGNPAAFSRPNVVAITEAAKRKYFGTANPIGQTLIFDKNNTFEIVGIVRAAPSHSSIQYDFVASLSSLSAMPAYKAGFANNPAYPTYVLVRDKNSAAKIEATMPKTENTIKVKEEHSLQPLSALHFENPFTGNNQKPFVLTLLVIAMLILVLALINYINLTIAKSTTRAKEVGIRKVVGARLGALSMQFYMESALATLIAFVLALILIWVSAPIFLSLLRQDIDTSFLSNPMFLGIVVAMLLICVILAGSYPSLVLSRFKPAEVIWGKWSGKGQGAWLQQGFTTFQFVASITLIICSLVVHRQLNFMQYKKIGLQKDQVLVIPVEGDMAPAYTAFKNELRREPGVLDVGAASVKLYNGGMNTAALETPTTHEVVPLNTFTIDEHFLRTLKMEWKNSLSRPIKPGDCIINETAIEQLKIKSMPLGHTLTLGDDHTGLIQSEISGVVGDFNYATLRAKIEPLVMLVDSDSTGVLKHGGQIYVRLDPGVDLKAQLTSIEKKYKSYKSESPFQYYFLDEAFDQLYQGEIRLANIFKFFTALTIFIACLGLFGLATFTMERKIKEIGIRKVLGASVLGITGGLARGFLKWVFIAFVIAAPLSAYFMKQWLVNFAYHIEISWWMFVAAGVAALVIAFLTLIYQGVRAAMVNPVESLKSE